MIYMKEKSKEVETDEKMEERNTMKLESKYLEKVQKW